MTMHRFLAPLPATYDVSQLESVTRARFPSLFSFNLVDANGATNAAAYFDDNQPVPSDVAIAAWRTDMAQAAIQHPTPDEQAAAAANVESTINNQVGQALDGLRAYINNASPTNLDTIRAIKLLCQVAIKLIRITTRKLDGTD